MVRRAFSGDASHRLPKGKIEPYRLWFEYLKLALTYPNIDVKTDIYCDWGDVRDDDFDVWWAEHWRTLFTITAGTALISSEGEFHRAMGDPRFVILRVSLSETRTQREKDIRDALVGIQRVSGSSRTANGPAFAITAKRSINYKTLRGMLKYLQLYNQHNFDIEATSFAYHKWSKEWNDRVRTKKLKLPLVYEPPFLRPFIDEIEIRKKRLERGEAKRQKTDRYDGLRVDARRFLRRGEKILKNVASGKFPGTF